MVASWDMFSVPSVLEETPSTVYRWASDSPTSLQHATELSTVSEEDDTGILESKRRGALSDSITDGDEYHHPHQLHHIRHLAKLLDKFNLNHPSPGSVRSLLESPSRISTPMSDSVVWSSTDTGGMKVRHMAKKVAESDVSLVSDNGSPREHIRQFSEGSAVPPQPAPEYNPSEKTPVSNVIARPDEPAPTFASEPRDGVVSKMAVPSRNPGSHRSEPAPDNGKTQAENPVASAGQQDREGVSSVIGDEDQLTPADYIFLLKQIRGLSQECENRGKIIDDLQRQKYTRQPAQQPTQQPPSNSMYVEPASPRQLNDLDASSPATQAPRLAAARQSSQSSPPLRHVTMEDANETRSPTPQQEEISFHRIPELDQSMEQRHNEQQRYEDDPTTIRRQALHQAQQQGVVHPRPIRSNQQSQMVDDASLPRLHSVPTTSSASYNDEGSAFTRRHEIRARSQEESRLLGSLNDSLRHSLRLEQDLAHAKAEIAELRAAISEISRKERDTKVGPSEFSERQQSTSIAHPSMVIPTDEVPVSAGFGPRRIPSVQKDGPSTQPEQHTGARRLPNARLYQHSSSTEVIEELEKLLGEAEKEVAMLKGNAKVLGPSDMPDSRRATAFKHDRLYYKLQMDHVDTLGVAELGNLIKVCDFT
ncbi:hypothetical protein V1525DRAFT_335357 [Lipomyces kononenkoae]|uniref:Uncharacterized protein n=1 Tax=Lipomyces kononenkoae TaxID=34357 RepID=A0ACC3TAX8_LIPKO